jgi:hypothetical protein
VWDEISVSNDAVPVIPSQQRITQQILSHCQPFRDLKLMFVGSRGAEQLSLRSQQSIVATVEDSVLRIEMTESLADFLFHDHGRPDRGRHCGDVELAAYLPNGAGPVSLVLDIRSDHDRFGSSSDLNLNGHLHYPNDIDQSLNEVTVDKIRKYKIDNFLTKAAELESFFRCSSPPWNPVYVYRLIMYNNFRKESN